MRLRTFTAGNFTQAMAQVRAALGDDAVILDTSEDGRGVTVIAAIDPDAAPASAPAPINGHGPQAALNGRGRPAAPPPAAAPVVDPIDTIYAALRDHGVPAVFGEAALEAAGRFVTGDAQTALAGALRDLLRFAPLGDGPTAAPLMLVGPPGAGKTQTIAKLAARALVAGRRVALITTDTERAAGALPLAAFARALKLEVLAAESPADLRKALATASVRQADRVLIDSTGCNHLRTADLDGLAALWQAAQAEPVLVLPAGMEAVEGSDAAASYAARGVRRMLATRLDLTRRLGSLLAVPYAAGLAFAEIGTTANIKDGLQPLDAAALARLLLPAPRTAAPRRPQQTGTDT